MSNGVANLETLSADQVSLIGQSRDWLRAARSRGLDVALHPETYLCGWSNVRGNARLLMLAHQSGARLKLVARRCKDALNVMRHASLETVGGDAGCVGYDTLVVSWCRSGDFAPDGEYNDRYFRASSRASSRTFWLTLATDGHEVDRRDPNVRVLRRRPGSARFDPVEIGRALRRSVTRQDADGRVPLLSATVTYAERVLDALREVLASGSFRTLIVPYEAQPFQQALLRAARRWVPGLRTVGYLHSALPPVPSDLIFRDGAPCELLVHGPGQLDILERDLGWPRERLRAVRALRYREDDQSSLAGFIFLPMDFANPETIVAEFQAMVGAASRGSLPPLVVRNHPVMRESPRHLSLQRALAAVLAAHEDRFSDAAGVEPVSVFIGATAAILEALERGVAVIHICSQPLIEAHTPSIWRALAVERLGNCLFRYRLRERGAYIAFGSSSQSLDEVIGEG